MNIFCPSACTILEPLPVLSVRRGRPQAHGSVIGKSQELLSLHVPTPLPPMCMESSFVSTEDSSAYHLTAEGQFAGPNVRMRSSWIGHCWADAWETAIM